MAAMYCLQPYQRYERNGAKFDSYANRVPRAQVACGRCANCVKTRKKDWTGKLLAEYQTSGSAMFVTLTYAKKPREFVYKDVQDFLKVLRAFCWRKKNHTTVRFFCVGERGDKFGRRHWHLVLFFSRDLNGDPDFVSNERDTPGQLWKPWPHGWTDIKPLVERSETVGRLRYIVKYAVKSVGEKKGERARCSLKPGLGAAYLGGLAIESAIKGIVPNGRYQIPGAVWSRGPRKGQAQEFALRGVNRREFIAAWRRQWVALRGEDVPTSDWLQQFDPEAISRVFMPGVRWSNGHVPRIKPGRIVVRDTVRVYTHDDSEIVSRWIVSPDWACELCVTIGGPRGGEAWLKVDSDCFVVGDSLGETLDIAGSQLAAADKWLKEMRPYGWRFNDDGEETKPVRAEPDQAELRQQYFERIREFREQAAAGRAASAERNKPKSAEDAYKSRISGFAV